MALTAAEAERVEFSERRGNTVERAWSRTSGGTSYDADSQLVQIRKGPKETDELVASSNPGDQSDTCALITTAGTDLTGDPVTVAWQISREEYLKIPAGERYWIGIDVTVDGKGREIQRHQWGVLNQTAVRG